MSKVNKEEAVALYKGGYRKVDIAKKYGVTRASITQMLQRVTTNHKALQELNNNEAGVLDLIRGNMLSALTTATTNDIPIETPRDLMQYATAYAVMYDKSRLQKGLSTENYSVYSHQQAMDESKAMQTRIKQLQKEHDESTD